MQVHESDDGSELGEVVAAYIASLLQAKANKDYEDSNRIKEAGPPTQRWSHSSKQTNIVPNVSSGAHSDGYSALQR